MLGSGVAPDPSERPRCGGNEVDAEVIRRDRNTVAQLCALVVVGLVTFAAFAPGLNNQFVYDDFANLVENPNYRGLGWRNIVWAFTTFHLGHYQPLSWLSLGLDYQIWELDPFGYHLTNLVLHTANALLCFLLIQLVLTRYGGTSRVSTIRWASVAGALLFAVHPLRVESVSWVTERRDVLSGLFFIACIYAYVRAHAGDPSRHRRWFRIAIASFFLSLLSKAWGITLPVVLLILDAYPMRRLTLADQNLRKVVLEKWPMFVGSALFGLLAIAAQLINTSGMAREHDLFDRVVQSAYGLAFYVGKTLAPLRLSPLYPLPQDFQPLAPLYLVPAVLAGLGTIGLIACRRRWPWAITAWLCFGVVVSPVLGVAQSGYQIAADRYTYLACLPFPVLVAAGLVRLQGRKRVAGFTIAAFAVVALALSTSRQTLVWRDPPTLWSHALDLDPDNNHARNALANWRREAGDYEGAMAEVQRSIADDPDLAESYVARAHVFMAKGEFERGLDDLNRAIELRYGAVKVFGYRGYALLRLGHFVGAISDFDRVLELKPSDLEARHNRGIACRELGRFSEAISDFSTVLAFYPGHAAAYQERGTTWLHVGEVERARADFQQVLAAPTASRQLRDAARERIARLEAQRDGVR